MLVTLAMVGGQTIDYWAGVHAEDERLIQTAYEVAKTLTGGKTKASAPNPNGEGMGMHQGKRVQWSG